MEISKIFMSFYMYLLCLYSQPAFTMSSIDITYTVHQSSVHTSHLNKVVVSVSIALKIKHKRAGNKFKAIGKVRHNSRIESSLVYEKVPFF